MIKNRKSRGESESRRELDIDSSAFFKLLLLVNLIAKPFSSLYETKYKITLLEWRVLFSIAQRPGIPASEIGEVLGLDKMAISRAVRALENSDRIVRLPDEADRRRQLLSLSKAGKELYRIIAPAAREREALLMRSLDERQRRSLDGLLDRLLGAARDLPDQASS